MIILLLLQEICTTIANLEMGKKHTRDARHTGRLQSVTLCISTAMVLVLLGLIVFCTLTGRNLSAYVKENLEVTMLMDLDMPDAEAQTICKSLQQKPYIRSIHFISKRQALAEATRTMGANPAEFTDGVNPCPSSIELTLTSDYANNDSLSWISAELKKYPKVSDINYHKDLVEAVNQNLTKIGIGLLVLAALLTFISFSLINNTVHLGIFARRFAVVTGMLAALIACGVLAAALYALYCYQPEILTVVTWREMAITGGSVFLFGIVITAICADISVNRFLRMKASELYKI